MIRADFHTHCRFSTDSDALPEELLSAAAERGLTHLCLTDHMDLDFPDSTDESPLFVFSPKEYFDTLLPLKEALSSGMPLTADTDTKTVPDRTLENLPRNAAVSLSLGVELGLRPHRPDLNEQYAKMLSDFPFDFVLASIHLIDDKDPYEASFWKNTTPETAFTKYFDAMLASITEFGQFDSLAHLDYLARYIPASCACKDYAVSQYRQVLDEILLFLITHEKALEVNTKGLSTEFGSFHPKPELLQRYYKLGGRRITIGSDAHTPADVALGFEKTRELLLSCGFSTYFIYNSRIPKEESL